MTTLEDDFLDDLDDLEGSDDEPTTSTETSTETPTVTTTTSTTPTDTTKPSTTHTVKHNLLKTQKFLSHISSIESVLKSAPNVPLSSSLLIPTTNYLPLIIEDTSSHHTNLINAYKPRFPGLEEVVFSPVSYASVASIIGVNLPPGTTLTERVQGRKEELEKWVKGANMMTLSVSSSMSQGRDLNEEEEGVANESIDAIKTLKEHQDLLMSYLSSLMSTLCPNMAALCGTEISAKIISLAGGLPQLTRIPACNLMVFGAPKTSYSSGTGNVKAHKNGLVKECDIVEGAPEYLRPRVMKVLCNKISLASRCDLNGGQSGGVTGSKFRAELMDKIAKWDSPDKSQLKKALPKPQMESTKKRGGRKVRAAKARFEEGEIHKLKNKRAFSLKNGEYGDDAMGMDLGMLGEQRGGAGVSVSLKGKKKQKLSMSKMAIKRRGGAGKALLPSSSSTATGGGGGAGTGFSTSVVFNSHTGLELADPEAAAKEKRIKEANKKWFGNDLSGFESAMPRK